MSCPSASCPACESPNSPATDDAFYVFINYICLYYILYLGVFLSAFIWIFYIYYTWDFLLHRPPPTSPVTGVAWEGII